MINQVEYYKDKNVRRRIAEYCGGTESDPSAFTSEYLVGYGEAVKWENINQEGFVSTPKDGFVWIMDKGLDIFRSNWDIHFMLGIMDVEYFNIDFPGEPYLNPARIYAIIEPVYKSIMRIFGRYGISPLAMLTGRGYIIVFKVDMRTYTGEKLASLGTVPETLKSKYNAVSVRRRRPVPYEMGLAHDGMGRLMEHVSHKVIKDLAGSEKVPVVITDIAVGQQQSGREAVSLDLSMYGDPLYMRDVRCPFSSYQKHRVRRYSVGEHVASAVPVQIAVPRDYTIGLEELLQVRTHFRNAAEYASRVSTIIPDATDACAELIRSYKRSPLFRAHRDFNSETGHDHLSWPSTYDLFDLSILPPCVAYCIQVPNDNIAKPTNLQTLTRVLIKLGWHPKHIAGLVRSKFERDYGWGNHWLKYDAATRADFYIRVFSSLIRTGLDSETDLNCVSHKEKGYCLRPWCGYNLEDYKL